MSAPKNVPAPPAGTASPFPPEGARTGTAGPVNAESPAPGRPTLTVADVLRRARDELLANSTPVEVDYEVDCGEPSCRRCRQDEDELRVEKRDELLHEDDGHAGLSLVIPALFAASLLLIAGVSGKLGYLWHHLPLTEHPNGFTLFCLIVLAVFCWRRLRRRWSVDLDRMVDLTLPEVTELPGPWFGTVAVEHPTDARWDKRLATDADDDPSDKWPVRS